MFIVSKECLLQAKNVYCKQGMFIVSKKCLSSHVTILHQKAKLQRELFAQAWPLVLVVVFPKATARKNGPA
jgi:hypothetical protein